MQILIFKTIRITLQIKIQFQDANKKESKITNLKQL